MSGDIESLTPRSYQIEMFEKALRENIIIFLPTGSGKTFIATMIIKHLSKSIEKHFELGGKRTFFLVNTVALAQQQADAIRMHVPFSVGAFTGDMGVDFWNKEKWDAELNDHQVLVMTAQIYLDMVRHSYISFKQTNLLIIDECHHASKQHPMSQIMELMGTVKESERPRIVGLTATLLNGNVKHNMILDELWQLEKTLNAKVHRAKNMGEVRMFSANPTERLIYYDCTCGDSLMGLVQESLEKLQFFNTNIQFSEDPSLVAPDGSKVLTKKKRANDSIKNKLLEIELVAADLGSFAAYYALLSRIVYFERQKINTSDATLFKFYCALITEMHLLRTKLRLIMNEHPKELWPVQFSTDKLRKLIEHLRNYKREDVTLVFVDRRIYATVLYYVFKFLKEHNEDFKDACPDFIVGCNANAVSETQAGVFQKKLNNETMKRFNKKETNILFASDVIEEGIDIRSCNFVVKFDSPKTFTSYIQSKGRARKEGSYYLIFVENESTRGVINSPGKSKKPFRILYKEFKESERLLIEELNMGILKQLKQSQEENEDLELLSAEYPPFFVDGPGSPCVTLSSSISLLNRYCSLLPSDKFTSLGAVYWKKEVNCGPNENKFVVMLKLPQNSTLRDTIESPPCNNIATAKAVCALEACKRLYFLKELNSQLLPVGSNWEDNISLPLWINEEAEENKNNFKTGTKKRVRVSEKRVPKWMIGCAPQSDSLVYGHLIRIIPSYVCPDTLRHNTFHLLLSSPCTFAIFTSNKWPMICDFPLFMKVGEVTIEFRENFQEFRLSSDELKEMMNFHSLLMTEVLDFKRKFLVRDTSNGNHSYVVAPVIDLHSKGFKIDWKTIRSHQKIPEANPIPADARSKSKFTKEKYLHKVVVPWYRDNNYTWRYIVTNVCENLSPRSDFPSDAYTSYEHYFSERYPLVGNVVNMDQPLLEVRAISKKINYLLPREKEDTRKGKKRDDKELEEILVPELCVLIELPAAYILKATFLPSVFHRITYFLLAEEMRIKINSEVKVGSYDTSKCFRWDPLVVDNPLITKEEPTEQSKSTIELSNMLMNSMISLNPKDYSWDEDNEPMDIERHLENADIISLIQYEQFVKGKVSSNDMNRDLSDNRIPRTSPIPPISYLSKNLNSPGPQLRDLMQVLISGGGNEIVSYERLEMLGDSYLKYISTLILFTFLPNRDEGKLTNIKSKIVGNRHLFYAGQKLGLGSIVMANPFAPEDWAVPQYKVLDVLKDLIQKSNMSPSLLFNISLSKEERESSILDQSNIHKLHRLLSDQESSVEYGGLSVIGLQPTPDKVVADCIEALIGVYLKTCGIEGALKICQWLKIFPDEWNDTSEILFKSPPSALLSDDQILSIGSHLIWPEKLESILGYSFKDRSFLLQALTHPSYMHFSTDCYQRLEFLGDAILDFLITMHIYEKCSHLTPGDMTDLRSALVNNSTFACLTVRYGIHKFILFKSMTLDSMIKKFVEYQEKRNGNIGAEVLFLISEGEVEMGELIEVPKVLGDVFESLAGAIFLDSGKSLETVWNVFYPLMQYEINEFCKNIPKNHLRLLYEKFSIPKPIFTKVEDQIHVPRIMVQLEITYHNEKKLFYGLGINKVTAKLAAAKVALRYYHNISHKPIISECQ